MRHSGLGLTVEGCHEAERLSLVGRENPDEAEIGSAREYDKASFSHDPERAFGSDEQVDEVHVWACEIAY